MGKKQNRKTPRRPVTIEEAERLLAAARRRQADNVHAYPGPGGPRPPRVDLTELDTPDVAQADIIAEFFNRPGTYYRADIAIPLDDEPLGEKLGASTVVKADDTQLLYLVEVLRQVRGAFGEGCRITLTACTPTGERIEAPAASGVAYQAGPRVEGLGAAHRTARGRLRAEMDRLADRAAETDEQRSDVTFRADSQTVGVRADGQTVGARAVDSGLYGSGGRVAKRGFDFKASMEDLADRKARRDLHAARVASAEENLAAAREMLDRAQAEKQGKEYIPDGPPQVYGEDWIAGDREPISEPPTMWPPAPDPSTEYSREELAAMMPGQTRAEVAAELGKRPEDIGGTVYNAEVMPEELAADLGVPVESLQRIPMRGGGGYAWVVKPQPAEEVGRHAAPADPPDPLRTWCCGTPVTAPHIQGCHMAPTDEIDYNGPTVVMPPTKVPRPGRGCCQSVVGGPHASGCSTVRLAAEEA